MSTDTTSNGNESAFCHFDRNFQEKIVQSMMTDRVWAAQIAEVIEPTYFEYAYLRVLTDKYLAHYRRFKEFPSVDLFITVLREDLKNVADNVLKSQISSVISNTKNNVELGDLAYVKSSALSFCRKQRFKNALVECAELVNSEEKYDYAVEIVKKSISAGLTTSPGLDLETDVDARYSETFRKTIRTNIHTSDGQKSLDSKIILNGGVGSGELNVVVANTGTGKSHFLVHFGAQAILQKKNVMHFTFELAERAVGVRYDAHILGIDSLECGERKEEIKEFYKNNKDALGKLRIKYFPTGTATVNTLRTFIDKLALENFKPDMVIIDYAPIMRSTEHYELQRFELKKIFEELRCFASELDLPVWTACQGNKEGSEAEIISLANMSEAYSQAHICDFVLGFGRPESQKASGLGTIFVAKNRNGADGMSFKVRINTAQSRLEMLNDEDFKNFNADMEREREDDLNYARKTFRDIKNKKLLGEGSNLELESLSVKLH